MSENKKSDVSEINSDNRLTSNKSFSLVCIKTNSNFLKKIDKKMNKLKKDKKFMEKQTASKILSLYEKFKISLETYNYKVPMWQYNFFNIILKTPNNNIENVISKLNKNFVTLPLDINKNNKRINLYDSLQRNSLSANNINTINASIILKRLLSEKKKFNNFYVIVEDNKISLQGNTGPECFTLLINSDNIYIDRLSKCKIKGYKSLEIVLNLAKRIRNIYYIKLFDQSDIGICSSCIDINLAVLKILTKGQSWYNSLGYVSFDYSIEKEHNKLIIDGKYEDFVLKLFHLIIKKYNKENEIDNQKYPNLVKKYTLELQEIIDICHQSYPPKVNQSVKSYFKYIWAKIIQLEEEECEENYDSDKNNWFSQYLNIIDGTNILRYDRSLRKYVR
jgi:hypothetical protein